MSAVQDLRTQIDAARTLVAQLYPILENDDVLARDVVEGQTDLHEAIRQGVARITEIQALLTGISDTIRVLRSRADAYADQEARIRAAMLAAMEVGNLPRLETTLGTVFRKRVPPSVVIIDEAAVPDQFCRFTREVSKSALKMAIAGGAAVPGATLSNGSMTIAIRT